MTERSREADIDFGALNEFCRTVPVLPTPVLLLPLCSKVEGVQTLPVPIFLAVRQAQRSCLTSCLCSYWVFLCLGGVFCSKFRKIPSKHWVPNHSPSKCEVDIDPANQDPVFMHSQADTDNFINYAVVGIAPVLYHNNGDDALCTHGRLHFDTR